MLVNRLFGVGQHVLQVAGQLFSLEKLLGVEFLVSYPLVLDAVDKGQALGAIDDVRHQFDERLQIPFEIRQPPALDQDRNETAPRELCPILKIGQQVGKDDIAFFDGNRTRG